MITDNVQKKKLADFFQMVLSRQESLDKFLADPTSYITEVLGENPYKRDLKIHIKKSNEFFGILPLPEDKEEQLKNAPEFLKKIIIKALENSAFKKELLSNPKAAISKETGEKIPSNVSIRIFENTKDVVNLVFVQKRDNDELKNEDLELVSGGSKAGAFFGFLGGLVTGLIDGVCAGASAGPLGALFGGLIGAIGGGAAGAIIGALE